MQITVQIELEQRRRVIRWPACGGHLRPGKTQRLQVQVGDEGVQEAHGVFGGDIILQPFGEHQGLGPVQSTSMFHACQTLAKGRCSNPCATFHTASRCRQRGMALSVPLRGSRHLVPRAWIVSLLWHTHAGDGILIGMSSGRPRRQIWMQPQLADRSRKQRSGWLSGALKTMRHRVSPTLRCVRCWRPGIFLASPALTRAAARF